MSRQLWLDMGSNCKFGSTNTYVFRKFFVTFEFYNDSLSVVSFTCTQPNHQITMKVVNHLPIKKSHIILLKISEAFSAAKLNNKKGGGGGKERKHVEINKWNLIGTKLKSEKQTNNLTDS